MPQCELHASNAPLFAPRDKSLTQRVQLGLALSEPLGVRTVYQKHNPVDLWEVISPQSSSLNVATEIISSELDVANGELFRG